MFSIIPSEARVPWLVLDKELSKRLQLKEKLTLAESVKMVRQSEIIKDQLSTQGETMKPLEVKKQVNRPRKSKGIHSQKINNDRVQNKPQECRRCGLEHGFLWPAKNSKCKKCNKHGHYARC